MNWKPVVDVLRNRWVKLGIYYFIYGISALSFYLFTGYIKINIYIFLVLVGTFVFMLYFLSRALSSKLRGIPAIIFSLGFIFSFGSLSYIASDSIAIYTRFGITEDTGYWFYSGILQGFAALLAIVGAFLVIKLDLGGREVVKRIMSNLYPAIILITIDLVLSIFLLPLSPVLAVEKYKSCMFTSILMMIIIGMLGVGWLCYALHSVYQKEDKHALNWMLNLKNLH